MYIIHEYLINGYTVEILDIISAISIICGIFVIISKNPIVSVLYLIGLFLSIASYLIFIGINFIGLSYLLVYVGAVSILFLFILMLINVRISELTNYTNNSLPLGVLIVIALNISICNILPSYNMLSNNLIDLNNILNTLLYNNVFNKFSVYILNTKGNKQDNIIYFISNTIWDGNISENNDITTIGNIIYTSHSIWLILTSIILLLAMVGAIIITIKQK